MADVFTREKRSAIMSRVRGRNNVVTELAAVRYFRSHAVTGWRRHQRLPGKPDFAFPRLRVAVFVDGCFWHGCPRCNRIPRDNAAYWIEKFAANRRRDERANAALRDAGWVVVRIWQCELRDPETAFAALLRLLVERGADAGQRRRANSRWTEAEDAFIRRNLAQRVRQTTLAAQMGRYLVAIKRRAALLRTRQ